MTSYVNLRNCDEHGLAHDLDMDDATAAREGWDDAADYR